MLLCVTFAVLHSKKELKRGQGREKPLRINKADNLSEFIKNDPPSEHKCVVNVCVYHYVICSLYCTSQQCYGEWRNIVVTLQSLPHVRKSWIEQNEGKRQRSLRGRYRWTENKRWNGGKWKHRLFCAGALQGPHLVTRLTAKGQRLIMTLHTALSSSSEIIITPLIMVVTLNITEVAFWVWL